MEKLGSIIYLKEGTKKIMIIGRGVVLPLEEMKEFFEYCGVMYPEGIDQEAMLYFNNEDIDEIIFAGYSDEEEERFEKLYKKNIDKAVQELLNT